MDRSVKLLLGLAAKLDKELEESSNITFEERPFLEDHTLKAVIIDTPELRERRRQNDENIKRLCSEIQRVCRPKPVKAVQDALFEDEKKGV